MGRTDTGADVEDGQPLEVTERAATERVDQQAGRCLRSRSAVSGGLPLRGRLAELVADCARAARPADRPFPHATAFVAHACVTLLRSSRMGASARGAPEHGRERTETCVS